MTYLWDKDLETGDIRIDNQHRQLFEQLNELIESSNKGDGKKEIFNTLDFLTGYTIMHFKTEEELQLKYGYPDYYIHKVYHEDFKTKVTASVQRLIDEGPSKELLDVVISMMSSWLVNHIKGDDFRMAAFIKSQETGN
jgi:hemerythrin